jgi:hypothetical protein
VEVCFTPKQPFFPLASCLPLYFELSLYPPPPLFSNSGNAASLSQTAATCAAALIFNERDKEIKDLQNSYLVFSKTNAVLFLVSEQYLIEIMHTL